jgi:hypothetical protein
MPTQRTIFGRPVTLQMPPRRFQALIVLVAIVVFSVSFYGPPTKETYHEVADVVKHPQAHVPDMANLPDVPKVLFGPAAHKPPAQLNSTSTSTSGYRAIEWLSDFKWRSYLSSTVAYDENRAVLPPTRERPPIYTYYDAPKKQSKVVAKAENALILAWRRAWWAQGFKPVVLSSDEAVLHPLHQLVQRMELDAKSELEIMRWLAWAQVGGGVLTNWLALPMAEWENPMLSFLRRGQYPRISRIRSLSNGVFFGDRNAVEAALKRLVSTQLLIDAANSKDKIAELAKKEGGAVVNLLPPSDIAVDNKADGIAYYTMDTIAKKYATVNDKLTNATQAEGLELLVDLVNSHLHLTFQEHHPDGLAVAKPLFDHTTALVYEATELARRLVQCPATPMPKSCPPNRKDCKPCDPNKMLKLQLTPEFVNSTRSFTIGTVPHPYTLTSLHYTRDTLDANFLRTTAHPDLWIKELTKKSIGKDKSESYRVVRFKELVAAVPVHSLWLTAEHIVKDDIDWILGFTLPRIPSPTKEPSAASDISELILFPLPDRPKPLKDHQEPDETWIEKERTRLDKAREALKSKAKGMKAIVEAVEQWNQADTEVWKFARAFAARRRMERKKWEADEGGYAGTEKKAGFA